MKETLQTSWLTYGKSSYQIEVVKLPTSKIYVSISQSVKGPNETQQEIKIHAEILESVIKELNAGLQMLVKKEGLKLTADGTKSTTAPEHNPHFPFGDRRRNVIRHPKK